MGLRIHSLSVIIPVVTILSGRLSWIQFWHKLGKLLYNLGQVFLLSVCLIFANGWGVGGEWWQQWALCFEFHQDTIGISEILTQCYHDFSSLWKVNLHFDASSCYLIVTSGYFILCIKIRPSQSLATLPGAPKLIRRTWL